MALSDGRLDAPAFHRNHEAIWSVLAHFLHGRSGDVLELGSGTGQHVVAFAGRAPDIVWWPSDNDVRYLASIAAWGGHAKLSNLRPPARVDLSDPDWQLDLGGLAPPARFLAVLCANVIHIAPWRVAQGLFAGAGRLLQPDGRLFLYGPFMRDGAHTAPSNAAFDASLRAQDPAWGVRDLAAVSALADLNGLVLSKIVEMPANNLTLVFARGR